MTEAQIKFITLEKRKEEIKKYYEDLAAATEAVSKEIGINGYFQDMEGVVYKVVIPEGKFVHFEKLSYVRTRRAHEKRGDLSMKEATDAGFALPQRD
jgi:hypothetical protein